MKYNEDKLQMLFFIFHQNLVIMCLLLELIIKI